MKLSVITICYNNPDIKKTCEGIVSQSYQDFEWIVIDGGSDKETLDVLNAYKNRINIFVSEKDNGIYNAMNKGIELSSGEYLNFLNAGDLYFNKNSLAKAVGFLVNEDIVFGDLQFNAQTKFIKKYPDKIPYGWFISESLPHPSSFIKKELFDKYGLYNEDNKVVSDWEKWIEFIDKNNSTYKHIPVTISIHNCDGLSAVFDDLHIKERADIVAKYYGVSGITTPTKKIIKFLGIPLMKVIEKFDSNQYYLFGRISIYKKNNLKLTKLS